MKHIKKITFTLLLMALMSSCTKEDLKTTNPNAEGAKEIRVDQREFSKEEEDLGEKLEWCSSVWSDLTSDHTESDESDLDAIKLVGIGIVGKNCINVNRVETLKMILSFYDDGQTKQKMDWNILAQKVLKMEQK